MSALFQDLCYGLRMLAKTPGFTAVAVTTLALGIGANTAIFSSVNAMLLRPFAFQDLDRAVTVWETAPKQNLAAAPANFRDWREHSRSFDFLAASHGWSSNLTGGELAERVGGYQVTADFFPLLGIAPQLGRSLGAGDFAPGRDNVVVLSYGLWQRHLGADPHVVGKSLVLNGQRFSVAGVMPTDFDFPVGAEVWAPLDLGVAAQADRSEHYLEVIGRLKRGVSKQQAQADLATLAARLAQQYPRTNAGHSVKVLGLVEDITYGSKQFLTVLLGAAAFVLLLACANVANLQLARANARQKEIAVRRALGASRARIVWQLLVESLMLALAGGAAGVLLASWGLAVMKREIPAFIVQHIPGLKHLEVDPRVLAFTLGVSLLTGILAGLAPAVQVSQSDLNATLKEGMRGGGSSPGRQRLRALLVVSEVGLALVLLVGAGLMVKGFRHLLNAYPGFDRSRVLTFNIALPSYEYRDAASIRHFYDQVLDRLRALPGAESVAEVTSLPSTWSWNQTAYRSEDQPPAAPGEYRLAVEQSVTPDFLRTLRVPLIEGRFISQADGTDAPPVVVLSASLARRIWPNRDAIGRRIKFGLDDAQGPWRTVVGLVGDIKQSSFDQDVHPTAYFPFDQLPQASAGIMIRAAGDPVELAPAARASIHSVDPNVPAFGMRTLEHLISDNLSGVDNSARMMLAFGAIALVLAAAGIFALMTYSVSQRTHEIGVRMALGARPLDVVGVLVGGAMKLTVLGLAIGVPLALALTKALSSALFGTLAMDASIFVAITVLLAAVAALASYIPARRATKVDPMVALRCE